MLSSSIPEKTIIPERNQAVVGDTPAPSGKRGNIVGFGNHVIQEEFASYLAHSGKATVPCFYQPAGMRGGLIYQTATLDIRIEYAFFHMNLRSLRRSQKFHFESISASDGSLHSKQVS